jgi:ribonuclease HI
MVEPDKQNEPLWSLDFDGVFSKKVSGAGVWVSNSETNYSEGHSYTINFQCTNSIAEYEALMLGLQILEKICAKRISIRVDSELIIKHIKGEYSTKHPRLRDYKNNVLDFLEFFIDYDLSSIPKDENIIVDRLATSASTCKIPFRPSRKYIVEVKNIPVVPNNIKYWKVFGNDEQIEIFFSIKE